jgi:hypothetical protein
MASTDWDGMGYGDRHGFGRGAMSIDAWREMSDFANRLMTLLALTTQSEVTTLDQLEYYQAWEPLPDLPEFQLPDLDTVEDLNAMFRQFGVETFGQYRERVDTARQERRWQTLLQERAAGDGIRQQQRLLSNVLTDLLGMRYMRFAWDERGPVMILEAVGIDEVVFSHIATIFLSPEVDVLVCSVCGMAFLFEDSSGERRPRYGVRRFCSDECRREGKRQSNRLSWRRNSSRWRRKSPSSSGRKEPTHDSTS